MQMKTLPREHRPKSDDPDFWAVWSGEDLDKDSEEGAIERTVDWQAIAADWQQISNGEPEDDSDKLTTHKRQEG